MTSFSVYDQKESTPLLVQTRITEGKDKTEGKKGEYSREERRVQEGGKENTGGRKGEYRREERTGQDRRAELTLRMCSFQQLFGCPHKLCLCLRSAWEKQQ